MVLGPMALSADSVARRAPLPTSKPRLLKRPSSDSAAFPQHGYTGQCRGLVTAASGKASTAHPPAKALAVQGALQNHDGPS